MAFPNFFGKQYESASNFLDDLEMAFLVSGRDEEEVKLRAFPLVLKDSAKNWFQNLEPGKKTNWETLKETFLSKYGGLDNPEHLWHRISSLHQATSRTYLTYESQFLRLWAEWEASLAEGERAPNFLKKEKFLAGLFPDLQEKVKGKFPETFEEALQIARVKDRKLEYQAHTSRVEHPQGPTMADERLPPAPTTTPEDPHLELLQRVTNQLDNLSINMVQGVRQQQPQPNNERMPNGPRRQPQRRDYFCYNCGEEGHGVEVGFENMVDDLRVRRGDSDDTTGVETEGEGGRAIKDIAAPLIEMVFVEKNEGHAANDGEGRAAGVGAIAGVMLPKEVKKEQRHRHSSTNCP
ncbi:hypothetical protein L7F22_015641 [Adiantum nelumboides]|nr:hypothetical protein [Adiantum nelumboides]